MFKIISIMFVGLGAGYLLRDLKLMRKTEKTIPLTVFAMLFILGISVGSNNLIVSNLGRFSGQAALLACFSVLGSIIAAVDGLEHAEVRHKTVVAAADMQKAVESYLGV